ncbi:MAG TPA: hypothetical protein VHE34_24210 [Puia sp.]|uniref:hypothetical protein n=1 Tax=Puia sp. TaxID=2045100 RepID=UPI002B9C3E07|nr:hypothetical protein [Puia sp.]HVU98359.1 hypothetical protein [Puia sp.]
MRKTRAILIFITLFSAGASAQSHLPIPTWGYGLTPWQPLLMPAAPTGNAKWQLRPAAGLSAGYIFFNHGGASYITAPLSLTLYHPLTPNVTAFAGLVAAPTILSAGSLYAPSPFNQPFSGNDFTRSLGINAGIQGGLMYTNDAHTFSISGSIYMERGSYPAYSSPRRTGDSKN